jgi:hypothetical protein
MLNSSFAFAANPALVSRPPLEPRDPAQYLVITPAGSADWTHDPVAATAFASMADAMRAAIRLPASLRAFGLPRGGELMGLDLLN